MGINFYKPTQKITGAACSFSFNSKEECVFIQLIKQVSYDAGKRLGTFNGGEKINLKFSMTETAGMIDALERNVAYSMFHTTPVAKTGINFEPYMDQVALTQKGFSLKIHQTAGENKIGFLLGFTFPEMALVKEYLKFALTHCFTAIYSADKKAFADSLKKKEEAATSASKAAPKTKQPEAAPEPTAQAEESKDPWGGESNPDDDF